MQGTYVLIHTLLCIKEELNSTRPISESNHNSRPVFESQRHDLKCTKRNQAMLLLPCASLLLLMITRQQMMGRNPLATQSCFRLSNNLFFILSNKGFQEFTLLGLTPTGMPRYLKGNSPIYIQICSFFYCYAKVVHF